MSGILTPLISRLRLRQRRFRQRVLRRTSSSTYASTGMDLADELTPLRLPSLSGPEAEWLLPEVTSESMALDNVEEEASLLEALRWVSRRDHDRISEIDGQGRPHELFSQRRGSEDEPVQSGEAMAGKMMEYASLQKTVQHMVVFGAGFVGGPLAVTLAFHNPGIRFTVVDSDRRRVDQWSSPFLDLPIREPGLDKLITDVRGRSRQQLQFCSHIAPDVLFKAQMIILCLPCPLQSSTTQVKSTIETLRGIIRHAGPGTIIAQKSTVPLGFGAAFQELMLSDNRSDLTYLSAPEFLSETCALDDLTSPSRLLIGIPSPATKHVMAARTYVALHLSFLPATTPIIFVSVPTAELAKLTANTLLATRLTVVNTVAALADRTPGAEVGDISRIVGLDPRIGGEYLRAGPGIGGSCLLENVEMLAGGAQEAGLGEEAELLGCVSEVARRRPRQWAETMLRRLESILSGEYEREARLAGQKIVVLGYAFKANSADVRNTPAKGVVEVFLERSLDVLVWDPLVSAADKALATEAFAAYARRVGCGGSVAFVEDVRRACRGALAVLQVVGHSEITTLDRLGGVTGHERIIRLG